jgi:hypothetical protein
MRRNAGGTEVARQDSEARSRGTREWDMIILEARRHRRNRDCRRAMWTMSHGGDHAEERSSGVGKRKIQESARTVRTIAGGAKGRGEAAEPGGRGLGSRRGEAVGTMTDSEAT